MGSVLDGATLSNASNHNGNHHSNSRNANAACDLNVSKNESNLIRMRGESVESNINYLCKLPPDIFRCSIAQFLLPFEQFAFCRISKYFSALFCRSTYNLKIHVVRDRNCWHRYLQRYYAESGGWLLFKNNAIDELPTHVRLCLLYFVIFYDEIANYRDYCCNSGGDYNGHGYDLPSQHKKAIKLKQIIPRNINHLRIISSHNSSKLVTRLICNILSFVSSTNPINAIYIERCNLDDNDVCKIAYALIQRRSESNLRGFSIGYNANVTDKYIALFFDVISTQCPSLKLLGLHATNISNKTCRTIYDYYARKTIDNKCKNNNNGDSNDGSNNNNNNDSNTNGNGNGSKKRLMLEKLYLMKNDGITETGIDILNQIFVKKYLDDNRLEHQVVINCARCGLKKKKDYWNRIIRV